MKPTLVFFGTDEFAAVALEKLIATNEYAILSVVTQPDRPVGRKQIVEPTAVKKLALSKNLPVFTPESLKSSVVQAQIPEADVYVVCVYGLLIPDAVLAKSKHGAVNIHPSLLPKYRGPSPIVTAVLNGDTETGITIMLLETEMDKGPILAQTKIAINPNETAAELMDRLAEPAADLLVKTLPGWLNGSITALEQDHTKATYCNIFSRDDGKIDWNKDTSSIYNQFRALTPWPGIFTFFNGKRLKLLTVTPASDIIAPGLIQMHNEKLLVGTKNGSIEIQELQLEGSKPLPAKIFLSGQPSFLNSTLG